MSRRACLAAGISAGSLAVLVVLAGVGAVPGLAGVSAAGAAWGSSDDVWMVDAETAHGTVRVHNHQVMAGGIWTLVVMEEVDGWLSIATANGTVLGEDIRLAGASGPFGAPMPEPLVTGDSILVGGPLRMFTVINLEVATPGQHTLMITVDGQATPVTITSVGIPAITLVNYTAPAGMYGLGEVIRISVSFSEPVTLAGYAPAGPSPAPMPVNASGATQGIDPYRGGNSTGAPPSAAPDGHHSANPTHVNGSSARPSPAWIPMNVSGAIPGVALYRDGNNTDTLYFEYEVRDGHHSASLAHVNGRSVQLSHNATLRSVASGVDADLALPWPGGHSIVIDAVLPQAVSARYESGMLDITFTEEIGGFNRTLLHIVDNPDDDHRMTDLAADDGGQAATVDGAMLRLELAADQRKAVTESSHPVLRLEGSAVRDMANNTNTIAYMDIDVYKAPPPPVFSFPAPAPPANRAPVFEPVIPQQNATEHDQVTFVVNATDPDGPGHLITYQMDGAPSGAHLNGTSGAFRWTPGETQDGIWTVTFKARDGQGKAGSMPVVINVTEANVAPVLPTIPNQDVYEETALEFGIVATDADLPPNRLNYSLIGAAHGASINAGTGLFSWTPTEAQGGSADNPYSFTVRVEDGQGGSDQATFEVTAKEATANNHHPTLTLPGIPSSIDEHDTLTFNATATDPDVPSTLSFDLVGLDHGATIGSSTGTFSWVPTERQGDGATSYMFTIRVDDGVGGTDTGTFSVTVNEVNEDPEFAASGPHDVDEGTRLSFTVSATDGDHPPNTLAYSASGPSGAVFVGDTFTWTPSERDGPGTKTVDFTVRDGKGGTGTMTVTINVAEVNQDPVFVSSGPYTFNEMTVLTFDIRATDADHPSNTLTYSASSLPTGASFSGTTFTWNATEAQGPGNHTATFSVDDGAGGQDTMTVDITVDEVNRPHKIIFYDSTKTTTLGTNELANITGQTAQPTRDCPGSASAYRCLKEHTATSFVAVAVDPDNIPFNATWSANLDGTTATWTASDVEGSFTWTPTEREGGDGSAYSYGFVFEAAEGPHTVTVQRTIYVLEVNTPPTVTIPDQSAAEHQRLTVTPQITDPDYPANEINAEFDSKENHGAHLDKNGAFTWTPGEEHGGNTYEFALSFDDGGPDPVVESFNVMVNETNQDPVLGAIGSKSVNADSTLSFTVSGTDSDIPANTLTYSASPLPDGAALNATSGAFSWTPTRFQDRDSYDILFSVSDGNGGDDETVRITVGAATTNAAPVLNVTGIPSTGKEGQTVSFTATATDADSDPVSFSLAGNTYGATITEGGLFSWTPTEAQGGSADNPHRFTIRVSDTRTTATATISINATEVNQDPVFTTNGGESIRCSWNSTASALSWPFELKVTDADLPKQTLQYMGSADVLPGDGSIPLTTISGGSFAIPDIPLNATSYDNQLVYDIQVIDELMGDPDQPVVGKAVFLIHVNLPGHSQYSTSNLCSGVSPN